MFNFLKDIIIFQTGLEENLHGRGIEAHIFFNILNRVSHRQLISSSNK
jgi:hypothetical protein